MPYSGTATCKKLASNHLLHKSEGLKALFIQSAPVARPIGEVIRIHGLTNVNDVRALALRLGKRIVRVHGLTDVDDAILIKINEPLRNQFFDCICPSDLGLLTGTDRSKLGLMRQWVGKSSRQSKRHLRYGRLLSVEYRPPKCSRHKLCIE